MLHVKKVSLAVRDLFTVGSATPRYANFRLGKAIITQPILVLIYIRKKLNITAKSYKANLFIYATVYRIIINT